MIRPAKSLQGSFFLAATLPVEHLGVGFWVYSVSELETGLWTISAGIPIYTLLRRIEAIGFPTSGASTVGL